MQSGIETPEVHVCWLPPLHLPSATPPALFPAPRSAPSRSAPFRSSPSPALIAASWLSPGRTGGSRGALRDGAAADTGRPPSLLTRPLSRLGCALACVPRRLGCALRFVPRHLGWTLRCVLAPPWLRSALRSAPVRSQSSSECARSSAMPRSCWPVVSHAPALLGLNPALPVARGTRDAARGSPQTMQASKAQTCLVPPSAPDRLA